MALYGINRTDLGTLFAKCWALGLHWRPETLLMGINYLKVYPTFDVGAFNHQMSRTRYFAEVLEVANGIAALPLV
jgi:hypothetical protein